MEQDYKMRVLDTIHHFLWSGDGGEKGDALREYYCQEDIGKYSDKYLLTCYDSLLRQIIESIDYDPSQAIYNHSS